MSNNALTYLIAALVGVTSVSLWAWLILVPASRPTPRWWQRTAAVVMSLYVLAAMIAAGGLIGAVFLWYYDRIGVSACPSQLPPRSTTWRRCTRSRTPWPAVPACPRSSAPRAARSTRASSCSTTRAPCSPSPPARAPTSAA